MQKRVLLALFLTGSLVAAPLLRAQSALLDLPRASQHAQVMQRVGITNITINYHRPLVKGRQMIGKVEPYGKVWRAGANENTTIAFSDPVTIEGKPLAKGTYGLHMIPGENEWTIIFSNNATSWGSFSYDQKEDALRVTVKSQPSDFHEALTYDFDDVKPNATLITMRWEKVAVPFHVEVNTNEMVEQSLHNQLRGRAQYEWQAWDEAANYLLDNKLSADEALKDADQSIQLEDRFENLITKARALDSLGKKEEATTARNKAVAMGTAIQLHIFGRQLQQQGKQEEAFAVFRTNIKRYPDHWLVHNETARLAVAKGDYDTAVKEMKLSLAGADDPNKPAIEALLRRLQAKEDINK